MDIYNANAAESKYQYTLTGASSQVLSIAMKPGDVAHSEPGVMMMMSNDVSMGVECGACSRLCIGEALMSITYTNQKNDGFIAFTPNFPGKVVPVDLSSIGGHLIARGGAYMAHVGKVSLTADFDCNCCRCCCGGMGFARQSVKGDGTVFLAAGGTIITKTLKDNENLVVDTNCIVGYQNSVRMGLKKSGGCCTICCGGEGMFNTVLTGPGLVIIQSMSFEKYKDAIAPPMPVGAEKPSV